MVNRIYVELNAEGKPTAFYQTEFMRDPSLVPAGLMELTEAQFKQAFDSVDRCRIVGGNITFLPAVTPPVIIPEVSDRQMFQQLAIAGIITQAEALAYVSGGTLPAAFIGFIATLPTDQQFPAKMATIGANTFNRKNSIVNALGAYQGLTAAQIDQMFIDASKL